MVLQLGELMFTVDDGDSQDPVSFNEPPVPDCGFHAISPDIPQFDMKDNEWAPKLHGLAKPVTTTPEEDEKGPPRTVC